MDGNIKSSLAAGVIAFVIYTVVTLLTGTGFGAAAGVGLIYLVGTAVVVFVIILIINAVRTNKPTA